MTFSARLFASSAVGSFAGVIAACALMVVLALPAHAQTARRPSSSLGDLEQPYGFAYGEQNQPIDADTRDANGNRLIVDGVIMSGAANSQTSILSGGASAWAQAFAGASGSATASAGSAVQGNAVGNQLNVITQGNYNTVIVNSTQTNTGNQTVVLNGKLNLQ
jgi:holdfast attachment protein HfaA